MKTHEDRIQELSVIIAQLDEIRCAYSRPTSVLARRARDAVKALQQAMKLPANAPKRKAPRKPVRDRLAWQRFTLSAQAVLLQREALQRQLAAQHEKEAKAAPKPASGTLEDANSCE